MMPSGDFEGMSDHELSDVVAYIQSVPPVDREMPRPVLGPVLNVMMAVGKVKTAAAQKKDHQAAHPVEPPAPAATVAFGQHMAQICTTCHTQSFVGGPITGGDPSWPPAANLTPHAEGLAGWTYDDFAHTMKSGKNRTGEELRVPMKSMAQYASNMTDTELKALWAYLQSLPPLPTRRD
jgi:cytochrome c5